MQFAWGAVLGLYRIYDDYLVVAPDDVEQLKPACSKLVDNNAFDALLLELASHVNSYAIVRKDRIAHSKDQNLHTSQRGFRDNNPRQMTAKPAPGK